MPEIPAQPQTQTNKEASSFVSPKSLQSNKRWFLISAIIFLILIGASIYWLRLNTNMFSTQEQKLQKNVLYVYDNNETSHGYQDILDALETIKEYQGSKEPKHQAIKRMAYSVIISRLRGAYYASGGSPEARDPKILEVLAQFREMARQDLVKDSFGEERWEVEGVESY